MQGVSLRSVLLGTSCSTNQLTRYACPSGSCDLWCGLLGVARAGGPSTGSFCKLLQAWAMAKSRGALPGRLPAHCNLHRIGRGRALLCALGVHARHVPLSKACQGAAPPSHSLLGEANCTHVCKDVHLCGSMCACRHPIRRDWGRSRCGAVQDIEMAHRLVLTPAAAPHSHLPVHALPCGRLGHTGRRKRGAAAARASTGQQRWVGRPRGPARGGGGRHLRLLSAHCGAAADAGGVAVPRLERGASLSPGPPAPASAMQTLRTLRHKRVELRRQHGQGAGRLPVWVAAYLSGT